MPGKTCLMGFTMTLFRGHGCAAAFLLLSLFHSFLSMLSTTLIGKHSRNKGCVSQRRSEVIVRKERPEHHV